MLLRATFALLVTVCRILYVSHLLYKTLQFDPKIRKFKNYENLFYSRQLTACDLVLHHTSAIFHTPTYNVFSTINSLGGYCVLCKVNAEISILRKPTFAGSKAYLAERLIHTIQQLRLRL